MAMPKRDGSCDRLVDVSIISAILIFFPFRFCPRQRTLCGHHFQAIGEKAFGGPSSSRAQPCNTDRPRRKLVRDRQTAYEIGVPIQPFRQGCGQSGQHVGVSHQADHVVKLERFDDNRIPMLRVHQQIAFDCAARRGLDRHQHPALACQVRPVDRSAPRERVSRCCDDDNLFVVQDVDHEPLVAELADIEVCDNHVALSTR